MLRILSVLTVLFAPVLAFAQGMMIPEERMRVMGAYAIKSVTIDATVKDQVAEVQLSQVFRNTSSAQLNVSYLFPIPPDAVICALSKPPDVANTCSSMYPWWVLKPSLSCVKPRPPLWPSPPGEPCCLIAI